MGGGRSRPHRRAANGTVQRLANDFSLLSQLQMLRQTLLVDLVQRLAWLKPPLGPRARRPLHATGAVVHAHLPHEADQPALRHADPRGRAALEGRPGRPCHAWPARLAASVQQLRVLGRQC